MLLSLRISSVASDIAAVCSSRPLSSARFKPATAHASRPGISSRRTRSDGLLSLSRLASLAAPTGLSSKNGATSIPRYRHLLVVAIGPIGTIPSRLARIARARFAASGLDRSPAQQGLAKQVRQIRRAHPSQRSIDGDELHPVPKTPS